MEQQYERYINQNVFFLYLRMKRYAPGPTVGILVILTVDGKTFRAFGAHHCPETDENAVCQHCVNTALLHCIQRAIWLPCGDVLSSAARPACPIYVIRYLCFRPWLLI